MRRHVTPQNEIDNTLCVQVHARYMYMHICFLILFSKPLRLLEIDFSKPIRLLYISIFISS